MPKREHSVTRQTAAERRSHAQVFAALSDESRLALLAKLGRGSPRSITQLAAGAGITRQAITKHLRLLERVHLVRCVRSGRESVFELDPRPLVELSDYLGLVSRQWEGAPLRLKTLAEESEG